MRLQNHTDGIKDFQKKQVQPKGPKTNFAKNSEIARAMLKKSIPLWLKELWLKALNLVIIGELVLTKEQKEEYQSLYDKRVKRVKRDLINKPFKLVSEP